MEIYDAVNKYNKKSLNKDKEEYMNDFASKFIKKIFTLDLDIDNLHSLENIVKIQGIF